MQHNMNGENFHCVYMLCSESQEKKNRGKIYIGYTVNPMRRSKQHNKGIDYGGAKKTNNRGPWTMVLTVHGFPNNISALQFEWAWQLPKESTRLKNCIELHKRNRNESYFDYNFRILAEILRTPPWSRLPLTITWINFEYVKDFPPNRLPPLHMKISYNDEMVKQKPTNKLPVESSSQSEDITICGICLEIVRKSEKSNVMCLNAQCKYTFHTMCLAGCSVEPGQYVPIEVSCPICNSCFLWGDIICKRSDDIDLQEVLANWPKDVEDITGDELDS